MVIRPGRLSNVRTLLRDQSGAALLMVTVAIIAMFAFAVLAIDVSILLTTRAQLQSAADAAALAGASGLLVGSQAEAIDRAVSFASHNRATQVISSPVIITPADVSFPQPNVVRVITHRSRATGDPLRIYFLRVINPLSDNLVDVAAVAAASAHDLCGTRCVKPWAIPDRWDDANGNAIYDAGEFYDPDLTGYQAPADVGVQIALKIGDPNGTMAPGQYYPVDFPPIDKYPGEDPLTGGDYYREWIAGCEPWIIEPGDQLQLEPGGKVGPTIQGMDELINLDPTARWDTASNTIINSVYGTSPRIGLVPFFDPTVPPISGRNYVVVSRIGAFFIESVGPGSQVTGRFIQITSAGAPCAGGQIGNSLVKGVQLTE